MSLMPFPQNADPFHFSGSVGRNGDNDRADVIKAQMLLSSMGQYDLPAPGVPTGWAGEPLFRAIGKVQKANGLPIDGLLLPLRNGRIGENGEGETLMSLQGLLGERLRGQPIPTPRQVDSFFDAYARDPDAPLPYVTKEIRGGEPALTVQTKEIRGPQPPMRIQLLNTSMSDEAPATPPAAGEQTAALPAALMVAPYLLSGVGAIAAGQYLKQQHDRNVGATFTRPSEAPAVPPSRPPDDTMKEQATVPPLQPPQVDTSLQGRPAGDRLPDGERLIPPETKDWISGLPPAQQPVAEGLAGIIMEINPYGSRGKPETEKANQIMARVCMGELGNYPDLAGKLEHFAGASKMEGEELKKLPEEVVRGDQGDGTFSRPDVSLGNLEERQSPYTARMNTVDMKKTGDQHDPASMTANERRRFIKLQGNIKSGVIGWARKMKPGESEAEYEDYVTLRCRAMWDDLDAQLRQDGVLPAR